MTANATIELGSPPGETMLRVLIVDDDVVDRRSVRRELAAGGIPCEVCEAATAGDALAMLRHQAFDCVLLDFDIPDGDGIALLRRVRDGGIDVPVIALTGFGDEETAVRFLKAGASDYLVKGSSGTERLSQSVRSAVEMAQLRNRAARADAEAREAHERLRLATEAAGIGTWDVDLGSGSGIWDERCRRILGVGAEEPLTADVVRALIHPRDRAALRRAEAAATDPQGDGSFYLECRILNRGQIRWIDARGRVTFAPAQEGGLRPHRFTGTVLDVTDRKRAEEMLREEAQLIDTIQRIGSTLTANLELDRIVQGVTDATTALTGAQIGAFCYNVSDGANESSMRCVMSGTWRERFERFPFSEHAHLSDHTFRGLGVVRCADVRVDPRYQAASIAGPDTPSGVPAITSFLAVPVTSHTGEVHGGLFFGHQMPGMFTDRHERLAVGIASWAAVAMDNARLYASEQLARAEAERANKTKSDFLAAMSHDLRTPLNAIGGFAQLVEDELYGPVTADQRAAMARIRRAQAHLLTLINDILNFAKIEAGRLELHIEPISVHATLTGLRPLLDPLLRSKRLTLEFQPGDPAATVHADRERLLQILLNLLTNAVKFTDDGCVTLGWAEEDDQIAIFVRDTGRGIPEDQLPAIFEPFVQAQRTPGEQRDGVGLGLAISHELARAMHGTLTAASRIGQGSLFTLRLPRG